MIHYNHGLKCSCVCVSLSECPPSPSSGHKAIYLNTGLTSTKNYGKTILTKVGGEDNPSSHRPPSARPSSDVVPNPLPAGGGPGDHPRAGP